jgi:hypothetical protein
MARDPWLDPIRTTPVHTNPSPRRITRRDAIAAYLEHEGDRILRPPRLLS